MIDRNLSDDEDLEVFEGLSEDEQEELLQAEMCGLPLDACLELIHGAEERREFVGSYAMIKIGTAAREVLASSDLVGPEDRAELAVILNGGADDCRERSRRPSAQTSLRSARSRPERQPLTARPYPFGSGFFRRRLLTWVAGVGPPRSGGSPLK